MDDLKASIADHLDELLHDLTWDHTTSSAARLRLAILVVGELAEHFRTGKPPDFLLEGRPGPRDKGE